MTQALVLAVLSAIEAILPLLGTPQATSDMIGKIITALENLLPAIVDEISTVYTVVKNIISLLQSKGVVTDDQLASLAALDNQVDTAWAAIKAKIDPDNPANAGTLAGS